MNAIHDPGKERAAQVLIDAAVWAPSVHNTQPWWFSTHEATVTLHADADRRLEVADPDGREMLISCGAALYTLRLAARCLDRRPLVQLPTDPDRPGLLADVTIGPHQPMTEEERRMHAQLSRRRTHRGGFGPGALPSGLLRALRAHAYAEGVELRIIADPRVRIALAALTEAAEQIQRRNPAYSAELARWAPPPGRDRPDGVHAGAYPRQAGTGFAARDFARGHHWGVADDEQHRATGVVTLLTTAEDDRADWLATGQALQRVLLRAAADDVSAAFHTQPLEIPELRAFIRSRFCDGMHPQMIMRLGIAGSRFASVRRPPAEVTRAGPA